MLVIGYQVGTSDTTTKEQVDMRHKAESKDTQMGTIGRFRVS